MPYGRNTKRNIDLAGLTAETTAPNLRPMAILEEVARAGVPVTPTEVNRQLGLPKQTLHRLFQTLESEGYLRRSHDGRSYGPGDRLNRLAIDVVSSQRVRTVRLAILTDLADKIGETCNIALPEGDAMVYLDRVETQWPLRIQLPTGTRVPLHATASGKLYLAGLDGRRLDAWLSVASLERHTGRTLTKAAALRAELAIVRERGYATDDEEFMDGMVAIAVPVHGTGQDGASGTARLVSTLSFHAPTQRMDLRAAVGWLDTLRKAASGLEAALKV